MGLKPTAVRQWKSECLYWAKLSKNRQCSGASKSNGSCKYWFYSVSNYFITYVMAQYSDVNIPIGSSSQFVKVVEDNVFANFVDNWSRRINSEVGPTGRGHNKLRMYDLMKNRFVNEYYCNIILPPRHRAAFSTIRSSVAPFRTRYEVLAEELLLCHFCNVIENEMHAMKLLKIQVRFKNNIPLQCCIINCTLCLYCIGYCLMVIELADTKRLQFVYMYNV